jgi:hypothetical protein
MAGGDYIKFWYLMLATKLLEQFHISVVKYFTLILVLQSVYNAKIRTKHQRKSNCRFRLRILWAKVVRHRFFPNPTTDFVITLQKEWTKAGQQSDRHNDLQGQLIKQDKINDVQSQVNLKSS